MPRPLHVTLLLLTLCGCGVPTAARRGVSFATTPSAWPEDAACLNDPSVAMAKEVMLGARRTVVIAGGDAPIPDAAWEDFRPGLGNIKNSDRFLLFGASCFARSPDAEPDCTGEACREGVRLKGYSWIALSQIEAADCLPDPGGCDRMTPAKGELLVVVTRKCHEMVFDGEIYELRGPAGERAVMHATEDGQPTTDVALPAGWSIARRTLDAPLTLHPFGGEDACYYNILRDHRLQSYHQVSFAGSVYP